MYQRLYFIFIISDHVSEMSENTFLYYFSSSEYKAFLHLISILHITYLFNNHNIFYNKYAENVTYLISTCAIFFGKECNVIPLTSTCTANCII